MIEIKNKEALLERINKLHARPEFRMGCPFCGGSHQVFLVNESLVEIDHQAFVQFFCTRCGYSMLLNYKVLMKEEEKKAEL